MKLRLVVCLALVAAEELTRLSEDKVSRRLEESGVMLSTVDFARKYGYPVETHTVKTEDGYLLSLHRIPGSPRASGSPPHLPVFLQHGLGSASDCFVLMGPERGIGFILADEGFDVWMGNARGNRYCERHVSIPTSDFAFYNYSFHEMGVYDLPAALDYVLEKTNQKRLLYVGHSMGAAMFLVLASVKPEYNNKIKMAALLSPGVFLKKPRSSIAIPTEYGPAIYKFVTRVQIGRPEFPQGLQLARFLYAFCADGKPYQDVCISVYFSIFGYNRKELNATVLPSIAYHGMSGSSIHLFNHYGQLIHTGRFQMYDRSGREYSTQPEYDVSQVRAPVALYYAPNDFLVNPEGVMELGRKLPNLIQIMPIADPEANHNDYIFAIHNRELVVNDILSMLNKFR